MRIAINGRFLVQPLTGVQRYARELLTAFDRLLAEDEFAGLSLRLVVPPSTPVVPRLEHIEVDSGARHVPASGPPPSAARAFAWEQLTLSRLARGEALFCPANSAPLARLVAGEPTTVTLHSVSFLEVPEAYSLRFRAYYRVLMRAICRGAQRVITVSEVERDRILFHYPELDARVHVVANGDVPERWQQLAVDTPRSPSRVLFVGSTHPAKNLTTLVRAVERLSTERPVELHVVGASTPVYSSSGAVSTTAPVTYHGQVSDEAELVALYRSARVLVHPSLYESSGLPPTEALALGCSVICSDLPVLRERCGPHARYFEAQDVAALTRVLGEELDSSRPTTAPSTRTWTECARETLRVLSRR